VGSFAWYDIPEASDGEEERGFGIERIMAFAKSYRLSLLSHSLPSDPSQR
jgi:hypothetical protein